MSRFTGWTLQSIANLETDLDIQTKPISKLLKLSPKATSKPDYPGMICKALKVLGIESVREYKFVHDRRFRFDIAIPEHKIAIEFEGGVWTKGRHTRGKGYISDTKKYNLAVMNGWELLRYTTEDTKGDMWEYVVAAEIKELIELKNL